MIFVVAALAGAEVVEAVHKLDRRDSFDHLEAQLVLAAKPQRRSVQYIYGCSIHLVGQHRQAMAVM